MFFHYGIEKGLAARLVDGLVAAVFGPGRNDLPIPLEEIVAAGTLTASLIDSRNRQELSQVVCPGIVDYFLVGEFVAPELLCDARFQRTFDGISGEIVTSAKLAGPKERLRLPETSVGQRLQVSSVHCTIVRSSRRKERGFRLRQETGVTERGRRYSQRLKINDPFVPPNPNEFDSAM